MRKTFLFSSLFLALLLLAGCSEDDNPSTPVTSDALLSLSSSSMTLGSGDEAEVTLSANNLPDEVFAISFRLTISDTSVVSVNGEDATIGDCFGTDAVLFVQREDSTLYATITRITGDDSWQTSGELVTIAFAAHDTGSSILAISVGDLLFYDENGEELDVSDVEAMQLVVTVTG